MATVLVIVPFAFGEGGMANRQAQMREVQLGPDIEFEFRGVKAGPALFDSYHDWVIADLALMEAGKSAQEEGYDAVCIDTMSDSGMNAPALDSRHPRDRTRPSLVPDGAHARQHVLGPDAVGPVDRPLQEGPRGVRTGRQVHVHPVDQQASRRREPAGRQGGRDLSAARGRASRASKTAPR